MEKTNDLFICCYDYSEGEFKKMFKSAKFWYKCLFEFISLFKGKFIKSFIYA